MSEAYDGTYGGYEEDDIIEETTLVDPLSPEAQWKTEYLSRAPTEFEYLGKGAYAQRRNVVKTEDGYVCEFRTIDETTYLSYINELNAPAQESIDKGLSRINVNQEEGNSDLTTIMMAIADLYEMVMEVTNRA